MYTLLPPGISPSLIKQYVYCPMIPWIIAKYGVVEPLTESMRQGLEEATIKGKGQIRLRSKKHRITCIIDEVVTDKKGIPIIIEYKKFKPKRYLRYKIQLLTQVLVAQETLGPIRKAVLIMGDKKIEYTINNEDLEHVKRIIKELENTINNDKPPTVNPNPRKCRSCWYKRFCPIK